MNLNNRVEHFVTLFDSNFLPQGLALHLSLERHLHSKYKLWILCVDCQVYESLQKLNLRNVELLRLTDLENTVLKRLRTTRTLREYCWTLTPFAPSFVFGSDQYITRVTYLDADIWFLKNPAVIFDEFEESNKSVLITEHAYAEENDQSATSGKYCVQFMIFSRKGEEVREWWEKKCCDWCYARHEDGKFGDQKYLEEFPRLFLEKVHASKNLNAFMAPWNATRFGLKNAILWHFHGLRIVRVFGAKKIFFGDYFLPEAVIKDIYRPYLNDLNCILKKLAANDIPLPIQAKFDLINALKYLLSKYIGLHRLFPSKNVVSF